MTWEEFLALSDGEQEIKGLAALRETVAEAGEDFVYRNIMCVYVAPGGGSPACVIGKAATRLGASINTLEGWDRLEDGGIANVAICLEYPISHRLITAWTAAQDIQDKRGTWGEALRAAEAVLR